MTRSTTRFVVGWTTLILAVATLISGIFDTPDQHSSSGCHETFSPVVVVLTMLFLVCAALSGWWTLRDREDDRF